MTNARTTATDRATLAAVNRVVRSALQAGASDPYATARTIIRFTRESALNRGAQFSGADHDEYTAQLRVINGYISARGF